MAYLVDTGVLLRVFSRSDPLFPEVREAIRLLRSTGEVLVTVPQNMAEFWNVCSRPIAARGGFGLPLDETARRLRVLESVFAVIDENPLTYQVWKTLVQTHGVMGITVHDARIVALMQVCRLRRILTLDPHDFSRYPGIDVETPAQIVARMKPR